MCIARSDCISAILQMAAAMAESRQMAWEQERKRQPFVGSEAAQVSIFLTRTSYRFACSPRFRIALAKNSTRRNSQHLLTLTLIKFRARSVLQVAHCCFVNRCVDCSPSALLNRCLLRFLSPHRRLLSRLKRLRPQSRLLAPACRLCSITSSCNCPPVVSRRCMRSIPTS